MDERVNRVKEFIEKNQIKAQITEFEISTKNSQLAAQALNCPVAQIAKSIVFMNSEPTLIIISGDKRVDTAKLSQILGSPASLADPETVLCSTGFPIGGVPPFAHASNLRVLIDTSLERFSVVYAAAGAPNAILTISLQELRASSQAEMVDIATQTLNR